MSRVLAFVGGMATLLLPLWIVGAQEMPAHPHGDLREDCAVCHTAEGWTPLRAPLPFDHAKTGFTLVDAHRQAGCRDCHRSLVFAHVPTACTDCHRDAHRGELGPDCGACHEPKGWTNRRETFRVHQRTRFPLIAAHARVDCEACHRGRQPRELVNTPVECGTCHIEDFRSAQDPDHGRLGFSTDCAGCHSAASLHWRGGVFGGAFGHPATFPLRGAHQSVPCSSCHVSGFAGTPRDCVACHRDDYDGTTNPNHRASSFPTQCTNCHTEVAWRPATIDHNLTRFPLTGAHTGVACTNCHANNRFAGTPTACASCHQAAYDRTTNPNHRASGFPTECQACHTTSAWRPASFDHGRTRFPLTGAHVTVTCASCHANGRYAGTPTDCNSCHADDYDRTTNPGHASSGFPRDCQACHSTNAWRPASFDHDRFFPLSGRHGGIACATCHTNPGNFGQFSCTNCHEHGREEMDKEHRDVRGYSYESTACYRCHPRGTE